jgi:hypothetical protein
VEENRSPHRRWPALAGGALVLLFGLGCLNYTEADGLERHRARAAQLGLPPPSRGIQRLGMATTALGGGLVGYAVGRGRGRAAPPPSLGRPEP